MRIFLARVIRGIELAGVGEAGQADSPVAARVIARNARGLEDQNPIVRDIGGGAVEDGEIPDGVGLVAGEAVFEHPGDAEAGVEESGGGDLDQGGVVVAGGDSKG